MPPDAQSLREFFVVLTPLLNLAKIPRPEIIASDLVSIKALKVHKLVT